MTEMERPPSPPEAVDPEILQECRQRFTTLVCADRRGDRLSAIAAMIFATLYIAVVALCGWWGYADVVWLVKTAPLWVTSITLLGIPVALVLLAVPFAIAFDIVSYFAYCSARYEAREIMYLGYRGDRHYRTWTAFLESDPAVLHTLNRRRPP